MKEESELMQKRKASDSGLLPSLSYGTDYLPDQKRQIVEKGKFVGAVGVIKPDAYKIVTHSDITNSPIVVEGCILSNTSSSLKIYEEDIVHIANDEEIKENSKAKEDNGATKCKKGTLCTSDGQMVLEAFSDRAERNLKVMEKTFKEKEDNGVTKCKDGTLSTSDSQMVLGASEGSVEGNLKATEENFKAKEDNGATKCKDGTLSGSDSQMVLEASHDSVDGNSKALPSKCREHPSPIRGVIHNSPSLNETCDKSLIKSSEKEGCFSFQATDETKTAEVSNNQSETLDSKIHPNNVIFNDEIGDSIGFESIMESQTTNTSEKNGSDLACQDKLSDANIIKPERKLVVPIRRKLLVLDVNGLLVDIISDMHNMHRGRMRIGGKVVFKRPFCDDFIKFCFEMFDIGIWSSRKRYNVEHVVEYLMSEFSHELLFCWGQDHCTFTGFNTLENADKPLVLKELKKLWNKEEKGLPWKKGYFSPSNTLLIDDSPYKALCNPPHTAIFPHPYRFDNENDNSLGPGGDLRVYLEGLFEADDVQLYVQQHPFGQQTITSEDPSWSFYSQVVERIQDPVKLN